MHTGAMNRLVGASPFCAMTLIGSRNPFDKVSVPKKCLGRGDAGYRSKVYRFALNVRSMCPLGADARTLRTPFSREA